MEGRVLSLSLSLSLSLLVLSSCHFSLKMTASLARSHAPPPIVKTCPQRDVEGSLPHSLYQATFSLRKYSNCYMAPFYQATVNIA